MSMSVEELRTLIRDHSTAMTNALEVSQAQNREFQSTLLGYSRWLARNTEADAATSTAVRPPTIIQVAEKDPHFPEWDGDRARLLQWLHQVEQIKRTKQLSDQVAVRYARHAMGVGAYGHFDDTPITSWEDFIQVLRDRFLTADIETVEYWSFRGVREE